VWEGWINAKSIRLVDVRPTHWRPWGEGPEATR
jgi:hypothetical protein